MDAIAYLSTSTKRRAEVERQLSAAMEVNDQLIAVEHYPYGLGYSRLTHTLVPVGIAHRLSPGGVDQLILRDPQDGEHQLRTIPFTLLAKITPASQS